MTVRLGEFKAAPILDEESAVRVATRLVRTAFTLPALFEGKPPIVRLSINADRESWEIHVELEEAE